jgi:hypothetical protein
MKLEPVRHHPEPAYPTREWVKVHPELLRRLPARWRNNPFVLGVLAAAPALGCNSRGPSGHGEGNSGGPTAPSGARPEDSHHVGKRDPLAKVAPIFQHGQGVASSGGVAATRIVFISEEEAVRIVREEAAKAGLDFAPTGKTLNEIPLPVTDPYGTFESRQKDPPGGKPRPTSRTGRLELDGTAAKSGVSFEVVTKQDFDAWNVPGELGSTLSTFDLLGTARVLQAGLDQAAPAGTYAVFYDPLPPYRQPTLEPNNSRLYERAGEEATLSQSREELRAQVRDFIAWLKAQGAL